MRDLTCEQVQVDELWAFEGMKQWRVPPERQGEFGIGTVWTFTSIAPASKLIPNWLIGLRNAPAARRFLIDLSRRMRGRFQLTTDGATIYQDVAWDAFAGLIDYAQLVKLYGRPLEDERVYSPPVCVAAKPTRIMGDPDPAHISTSHVERENLNLRIFNRRYTRLTNAFSKKVYNLSYATALYVFHRNFVKPHGALTRDAGHRPTTPAMAAGLATKPWRMTDIVKLIEAREEGARDLARRLREAS